MKKLFVVLIAVTSFSANAQRASEETVIMANHNYERAISQGKMACESIGELIKYLGGDNEARSLALELCSSSQSLIDETLKTKIKVSMQQ